MNRGGLGARALNLELQLLLNPPGESLGWCGRLALKSATGAGRGLKLFNS